MGGAVVSFKKGAVLGLWISKFVACDADGAAMFLSRYTLKISSSDAEEKTFLIFWKSTSMAPLVLSLYLHPR